MISHSLDSLGEKQCSFTNGPKKKQNFQKDKLILPLLKSATFNSTFTPGLKDENLASTQVWTEASNFSKGTERGWLMAQWPVQVWSAQPAAQLAPASSTGTHPSGAAPWSLETGTPLAPSENRGHCTPLWLLIAKWGQELLSSFRYPLTPPPELLLKVSVCLGGKLNKAIENINIKYYIICPGLKRFWLSTY